MASPTFEEKIAKIKSPGLESQQRNVHILGAIEETLKEQNTPNTPTGYFAALLAVLEQSNNALEKGASDEDMKVIAPVVYLLDVIMPYAPEPLLRAKFNQIVHIVLTLSRRGGDALLTRSCIGCIETLIIAQDAAAWELSSYVAGPRLAISSLIPFYEDPRPKIRKRACDALKNILSHPPPSPALDHPASEMCAQQVMTYLTDLKKKQAAADADQAVFRALQLTKAVAGGTGGWPSKQIEPLCELLLGVAKAGTEQMTKMIFDVFEIVFEGMADEVSSSRLPRMMEVIVQLQPSPSDTQLVPPWLAIVSRGYDVSAQVEPEETFQKLPEVFEMVSKFMESPAENIRISASECLISFMVNCVPNQVLLEPSIYDQKILEKVARLAEGLLSVQYQAAWLETFNVLGAMFEALRWAANPVMLNITKLIGEIRGNSSFRSKKEADEVLGQAVRAMGPEAVLSVLPLNLVNPAKGAPGRAWLMPILRSYVSNTNLAHFKSEMVTLSEAMFQRVLNHGEAEKTMEIKIFETLVQQVWSTLPGYCDLPLDLIASFDQGFAEILANILYQQVELRLDVCRSLRMLVDSNKAIATIEEEDDLVLQSRVSQQQATENLAHLGTFAANMLAVLFNVYTQTLPQSRGPILQTINAFLSITPQDELMTTFERVTKLLGEELDKEPPKHNPRSLKEEKMPSTSNTLMDLVITISPYLPREAFGTLFEIAAAVIDRENEPQLQKKAYKLLPRLSESEEGVVALTERNEELQALLIQHSDKVSAPARRDRLAALSTLITHLPSTALHFIPQVLSEVVICCKENNEKARETAYDVVVQMGETLIANAGTTIDNSKVTHMPDDAPPVTASIEEYFTMVSAGLAGSTPHMISATITALSRMLYEFAPVLGQQTLKDLVETMDLFLTSNNREIAKSVLGFVKIVIIRLDVSLVKERMGTLVPNLIVWSHEHKGHFKAKVKHILERMIRRFGYDIIHENCPEPDRKLLVNIRKTKERTKRKKDEAREGGGADGSSDEEKGAGDAKFDNEYDEALYSSDDSEDDGVGRGADGKWKGKGANAYIVEDEHEPLDLLDKRSLANISSTRPQKMKKKGKTSAKVDLDGKLILQDDAMDIDGGAGAEGSGVNAYVAALKGKDAGRRIRGGKLKFSNKRRAGGDDDDEDGGEISDDQAFALRRKLNGWTGLTNVGVGQDGDSAYDAVYE
ncbi:probable ribosomal RNA-processing protein 12 [Cephalotrichum gorgonifer]|uniref:Probable ribosomal RNA-processing protein 12 n=1 Tax=Cephalotrichum gorgonifer TaxID=2041049 RepID=A0AAE8N3K7_9PEZI|nr:probable ribosomal RNA-processing protein 12 [Cephalotrichum gorgonifer]